MFVMVSRSQPRSCKRQQNPLMTNFVNIINKQFGDRASQRGYSTLFINEGTQLHTMNGCNCPAHLLPCHLHWKGRNPSHKRSQLRHPGGSDTPESRHCPWEHLRGRGTTPCHRCKIHWCCLQCILHFCLQKLTEGYALVLMDPPSTHGYAEVHGSEYAPSASFVMTALRFSGNQKLTIIYITLYKFAVGAHACYPKGSIEFFSLH